jgi:hypothetical protein
MNPLGQTSSQDLEKARDWALSQAKSNPFPAIFSPSLSSKNEASAQSDTMRRIQIGLSKIEQYRTSYQHLEVSEGSRNSVPFDLQVLISLANSTVTWPPPVL